MRTGIGYDMHKLVSGKKLILGGVKIPYKKGLTGHTDADVLVHAIIDAMLGAAGLGDIGQVFPDSDPKWKNANSLELLEIVHASLKNKGFDICNIDSTIVTEEPRLSKHINKMKNNISDVLEIDTSQIGIKAKTNEGMDSVGNKESICAFATVLLD